MLSFHDKCVHSACEQMVFLLLYIYIIFNRMVRDLRKTPNERWKQATNRIFAYFTVSETNMNLTQGASIFWRKSHFYAKYRLKIAVFTRRVKAIKLK